MDKLSILQITLTQAEQWGERIRVKLIGRGSFDGRVRGTGSPSKWTIGDYGVEFDLADVAVISIGNFE